MTKCWVSVFQFALASIQLGAWLTQHVMMRVMPLLFVQAPKVFTEDQIPRLTCILVCFADEKDREMGELGSDDANELDRNMWAPEEEDADKEVSTMTKKPYPRLME